MLNLPLLNRILPTVAILFALTACTPVIKKPGLPISTGKLSDNAFTTTDGITLALNRWRTEQPKAVLIALHGFNDYRAFFNDAGQFLAQNRIYCYAYDQRGFGNSPNRGFWAGRNSYTEDLISFIRLVKMEHPDIPVYVLGESMGGAVIIDALNHERFPQVNGIILAAPAVWGRQTMPWYQNSLLWLLAHTMPWLTLTGDGLEIMPSDNLTMLRALSQDPLVIKETRVDAIHGLTGLMDAALAGTNGIRSNMLLLYGEKDEIIPATPIRQWISDLQKNQRSLLTLAYYRDGYHMLLRDLQAVFVWQDILTWINDKIHPLPSGADRYAAEFLQPKVLPFQPQNSAGQLLNSM